MAKCRCGASGDVGELVEHCVSGLGSPDDQREHGLAEEPEQVATARASRRRAEQVRQALADAAGVSVAELRAALR
jgi:hypothetical protein